MLKEKELLGILESDELRELWYRCHEAEDLQAQHHLDVLVRSLRSLQKDRRKEGFYPDDYTTDH